MCPYFLFYLDLHVPNFFSSMSLFTKRQKGVFMKEIVQIFEVPLIHKVTKFIQSQHGNRLHKKRFMFKHFF
jgi:hypothetical protein